MKNWIKDIDLLLSLISVSFSYLQLKKITADQILHQDRMRPLLLRLVFPYIFRLTTQPFTWVS